MKYKIGDKVKIREDLKGGCEYDGLYFDRDMEKYNGKIATITGIGDYTYSIDLDKDLWNWNDDMFEYKIQTKKQLNDKIIELEKQIAELKEQLEKKDNKMSVGEIWKPEKNEPYYFNYSDGTTDTSHNYLCTADTVLMLEGNCYPTKEKAEFEAQREKYTRLFRQYVEQHSEPLDWNNSKQQKCLIKCYEDKFIFDYDILAPRPFVIYASSKQVLQEAIDFVGEDNVKRYILEIK